MSIRTTLKTDATNAKVATITIDGGEIFTPQFISYCKQNLYAALCNVVIEEAVTPHKKVKIKAVVNEVAARLHNHLMPQVKNAVTEALAEIYRDGYANFLDKLKFFYDGGENEK